MSEQAFWTLFCLTGRPEFYTLYTRCRQLHEEQEQADQNVQSA